MLVPAGQQHGVFIVWVPEVDIDRVALEVTNNVAMQAFRTNDSQSSIPDGHSTVVEKLCISHR
jgi:hypothetical protein